MSAQHQAQLTKIMLGCQEFLYPGSGEECIGGAIEWDYRGRQEKETGGGERLCKGSQQTCLSSSLISLRLLFCGLVQVIGLCGTFGVPSLPTDTVPGDSSEAYP